MDAAKQRVRAAAARKKEEVKLAKGIEEGTSSAPKIVNKVSKGNLTEMMTVCQKGLPSLPVTPLQRGSHPLSQAMVRAKG